MNRWARATIGGIVGAGIAAGAFAASGSVATAAPASGAASMVVPVDRQDYVAVVTATNPKDGSTVDPYNGDPSSIHVAVTGGKEFARSFVHLSLDYLPGGAVPTGAIMTLFQTQQSDASTSGVYPIYNLNSSAAIVQACALTAELPATFDSSKPPAYDCQHGSSVGRMAKDGKSWTFDLVDLLRYWKLHGNTGAALVPVGSGEPSETWQVAFYRSRSTSTVTYTLPASSSGSTSGGSTTGAASGSGGASTGTGTSGATGSGASTASAAIGPGTTAAVPSAGSVSSGAVAPSVAGSGPAANQPGATQPGAGAPRNSGGSGGSSTPSWPWVLLGSLVVAGAAVAWPHRAAIAAALPKVTALWRTHPRAHTVAAAAVSWGLVFTSYSLVTQPPHHATQLAGNQQGTSAPGAGPSSVPGTPGAPGPLASAAGGAARPGVAGTAAGQVAGQATAGGAVAAGNGATAAAQNEFTGAGTWKTINGVRVFFPADGGVPVAQLYKGADDVIGMTPKQIEICAHAALTYGSAFHISASDLNVFWQWVGDHGGIYGRSVHGDYTNDNYDPGQAVQAAQSCKDKNTFILLGGIGFDQIPAVRQWAEQNHELYLHHIATIEGSAGLRYSFSALPTVEQTGTYLGEIAARQFPHKKIAIIYRQSSNWTPALGPFKQLVTAAGSKVVGEYGVQINQGNYTQELTQARSAGAEVVLSWENALSEIEMIKQAQAQNWHPAWLVNGFNIITNTLGSTALDQDMWSAGEWDPYDPGYYGGGFTSYAAQIHEFEAQYKKYDPSADLTGDGGDLLFLNWESQKWLYDLLLTCGKDCTRNKVAGLLLAGYHKVTPPNCVADFGRTGDHHHGGFLFNVLHAVRDPNGRPNFVPVQRCVTSY